MFSLSALKNAALVLALADKRAGIAKRSFSSLLDTLSAPALTPAHESAVMSEYARAYFA